ncbi:MAG: hypothetical protein ACRDTE_19850 [Pseudonocardiaceae bacterium]
MRRNLSQISGVVALSIAALAVTTNVSAAQTMSSPQGQLVLRMHNADGSVQSESSAPLAAAGEVVCDAAVQNPHYSPPPRAASVIFKTRIACHGNGAPVVQVRVTGSLGSVFGAPPPSGPPQGPPVTRATSDQTQNVTVNGPATTYYTPRAEPGNPKVRGSGWYQGDITGQIVGPPGVVTPGPSRASSNRAWVNDPG